jgi:hypothetical protein
MAGHAEPASPAGLATPSAIGRRVLLSSISGEERGRRSEEGQDDMSSVTRGVEVMLGSAPFKLGDGDVGCGERGESGEGNRGEGSAIAPCLARTMERSTHDSSSSHASPVRVGWWFRTLTGRELYSTQYAVY